jgi:P27 family predicted phage terminase small subunit
MPTPRKANDVHRLQGTIPHDRAPETPSTLVASRPRYPKNLTPEAKRVFKQLCRQLADRKTLTEGDEHLLTLYVTIWDRRARAQEKLLAEGEVCAYTRIDPNGVAHKIEKPNLHLKIASDCESRLVAILDRLGLTPLAGSKVKQTRANEATAAPTPGTIGWILQEHARKEAQNADNLPS